MMSSGAGSEEPSRKRRRFGGKPPSKRIALETVAPQPTLELLPDNITLTIMGLLDAASIIHLSRVCKRFYHLHRDESVWTSVDLTTVGRHLDVRKLKRIICDLLPVNMASIRLSSPRKKSIVTVAVLDELFTKCPHVRTIQIEDSDITALSEHPACKLFRAASLERLLLTNCVVSYKWLEKVQPSWSNLTHLSLSGCVKTSDHDLDFLASNKTWTTSVRSLKLQGCYRITDTGMKTVADNFKCLTTLDISNCKGLTEQCISHISRIPSLRDLTVVGIPFSSEVYTQLPKHFPNLRRLALTGMPTPTVDIASFMSNTKVTVHMPQ